MTDTAAFRATFSDFKLVRSRKVSQLIFEVPVEETDAALRVLGGMPNPASEVWCGIARLQKADSGAEPVNEAASAANAAQPGKGNDQGTQTQARQTDAPHREQSPPGGAVRKWSEAQRAGMLCNEPSFQRFLFENGGITMMDAVEAANCVRDHCLVQSRSEIDSNPKALERWRSLTADYDLWMRGME